MGAKKLDFLSRSGEEDAIWILHWRTESHVRILMVVHWASVFWWSCAITPSLFAPRGRGKNTPVGLWNSKVFYYSHHISRVTEAGTVNIKAASIRAKSQLQFTIRTQLWGTFPGVPSVSTETKRKCFCPANQIHSFFLLSGTSIMFGGTLVT